SLPLRRREFRSDAKSRPPLRRRSCRWKERFHSPPRTPNERATAPTPPISPRERSSKDTSDRKIASCVSVSISKTAGFECSSDGDALPFNENGSSRRCARLALDFLRNRYPPSLPERLRRHLQ